MKPSENRCFTTDEELDVCDSLLYLKGLIKYLILSAFCCNTGKTRGVLCLNLFRYQQMSNFQS